MKCKPINGGDGWGSVVNQTPLLCFLCTQTNFLSKTHVHEELPQAPWIPAAAHQSCPCLDGCMASKVKCFIFGEHKHEIGIGVVGKFMGRYYRDRISCDVQTQMSTSHSHRWATAFPMTGGPTSKQPTTIVLCLLSGCTSPTGSPQCILLSLCCPVVLTVLLLSGLHDIPHFKWWVKPEGLWRLTHQRWTQWTKTKHCYIVKLVKHNSVTSYIL